MTEQNRPNDPIARLLAEAEAAPPAPLAPDFAARLMADARAALPRSGAVPPLGPVARLRAALAGWLQPVGGAPGLAGLAVAGLIGVGIGFSGVGAADALAITLQPGALTPDEAEFLDLLASDDLWEFLP
jgi:hypothetical protein